MRSISFFVVLLILVFGCKKDQPTPKIEPEVVIETVDTVPQYWSIDGKIRVGLAFDEQVRLTSSKNYLVYDRAYELDHYDQIINFEYFPDGRIKSGDWGADGNPAFDANYFYKGNILDSIVVSDNDWQKTVYTIEEDPTVPCKLVSYQVREYRKDSVIRNVAYTYEYLNNQCNHIVTRYIDGDFASKTQIKYSDKRTFGRSPWQSLFFENAYPYLNKYFILEKCDLEENGTVINCNRSDFSDREFNEHNFVTRWSTLNYTYR